MIIENEKSHWFVEDAVEGISTGFALQNKDLLHSEKSDWQLIEVYQTETFGKLLAFDGIIMLTQRDNFLYHEMISHPAILNHQNPENVVIIGGGDCGTIKEVLKHDEVKQVTQVEIDERVTRVCEEYFPELCSSNDDPRANFQFADGVEYIKQAEKNSIDIIIIDSTDPVDFAEGLFNEPFYKDCLAALKPGGIISQQSESPFVHQQIIREMHGKMLNAGLYHVQLLNFPQPCYPSGWWSVTIASADNTLMNVREFDHSERGLDTLYLNESTLAAARAAANFWT